MVYRLFESDAYKGRIDLGPRINYIVIIAMVTRGGDAHGAYQTVNITAAAKSTYTIYTFNDIIIVRRAGLADFADAHFNALLSKFCEVYKGFFLVYGLL